MGLKLNATTGGGSVELDVPGTVNSDFALTVPAAAGTIDRLERVGNVLQVVHEKIASSSSINTTGTTFLDTECEAQITPIGTGSLILVIAVNQAQNSSGGGIQFRLMRNTSAIGAYGSSGYLAHFNSTNNDLGTDTMVDVDDAANLSGTLTYKMQYKANGGGTAFTKAHTMTLVEIAR